MQFLSGSPWAFCPRPHRCHQDKDDLDDHCDVHTHVHDDHQSIYIVIKDLPIALRLSNPGISLHLTGPRLPHTLHITLLVLDLPQGVRDDLGDIISHFISTFHFK